MHQKYLAGSSRHCQQELESAQAELLQNLCGTMLATLQEVHTQLSTSYKVPFAINTVRGMPAACARPRDGSRGSWPL